MPSLLLDPFKVSGLVFTIGLMPITGFVSLPAQTSGSTQEHEVEIVLDEAEAVVAILNKLKNDKTPSEQDWERLFESEGFLRLQRREQSFGNEFKNETFKSFLIDDNTISNTELFTGLIDSWRKVNLDKSVEAVAAYLPKGTLIKASLFPVIKPLTNSFVFF